MISTPNPANTGFYLQDQIDFNEKWKALVGLRYQRVDLNYDARVDGLNRRTRKVGRLITSDDRYKEDAFLPRFGVVYQPIETVGIFTSYSTSYRPPTGVRGLTDRKRNRVKPERSTSYEVGVKLDAYDGELSGTVSMFQIDKKDVRENDPRDFLSSVNVGKVRSRGFEFDLSGNFNAGTQSGRNLCLYLHRNQRGCEKSQRVRCRGNPPAKCAVTYSVLTGCLHV